MPEKVPVIQIREAHKSYGAFPVLRGINMSVESGTIYGLLGPSGCGKTTLMNCIVGSKSLDAGTIDFNFTEHKDLGFMPQDIALHTYLTIREVMTFYGYLFSMNDEEIESRAKYLAEILELPPLSRTISNLSGGQQRRVSIAIALLHDPKVLILDEPTVGLDPLLCTALWDRLLEMSQQGKTIIVTTHYIEEARRAHMIGLMRNGRMLTEDSPSALLQRFNVDYLEDVFLALCNQDNEHLKIVKQVPSISYNKTTAFESERKISLQRIKALVWKNLCLAKRNFLMTLFVALLPVVLVCCVEYSYGHDAVNLPIGLINKEFQDSLTRCPRSYTNNCILGNEDHWASCAIIDALRDHTYKITEYTDVEEAKEDFNSKRIYSILTFPSNFTKSLGEWVLQGTDATTEIVNAGSAFADMDKTDVLFYYQLMRDLPDSLLKTVKNSLETCVDLVQPRSLLSAIEFKTPIHGSSNIEMIVYFVTGFNIICCLFCPMIYACAMILDEKDQGVIDRVLCCGTTMKELLASHMVLQICMATVHVIELYIVTYYVFANPLKGEPYLIFIMLGFTAMNGIITGTAIGLVTEHLMIAVNLGVAFNFLMSYSSGLFWPFEGAHPSIKRFLPYTPIAGTITATRSVSLKGLGMEHSEIVFGVVSTVSWCIGSILILWLIVNHWKGPWSSK